MSAPIKSIPIQVAPKKNILALDAVVLYDKMFHCE